MRTLAAVLVALPLLLSVPACAAERTWVEISIFCQCCEPPWGKSETDIRPFFARNGVTVHDFRKESRMVCAACSCPSPVKQLIQVSAGDVSRVREILARSGQPEH